MKTNSKIILGFDEWFFSKHEFGTYNKQFIEDTKIYLRKQDKYKLQESAWEAGQYAEEKMFETILTILGFTVAILFTYYVII